MKKSLIAAIAISLLATSCISIAINKNLIRGEGDPTTALRTYEGEVSGLGISSCADVILDSSIEPGTAQITTSPNIMEFVEIRVENNILYIGLCDDYSYHVKTLEIRVSPVNLSLFAISGGASLKSSEAITSQDTTTFAVSGGADVNVCGAFNHLSIAASGGADINLSGRCNTLDAALSGGVDADLYELQAVVATVSASGGSDVKVNASQEYHIQASGGADVIYCTTGATLDLSSSGGADITALKRLMQ
ncbi:MAG: DUF2807 domain-containing protein [Alistipes sp.]|nr:DUF2807 domain-containing protein [Alistipes sp.]